MIEPCKPLSVSMTGYGRELLSGPLNCWRNSPLCGIDPRTARSGHVKLSRGGSSVKRGLLRAAISRASFTRSLIASRASDGALSQSVRRAVVSLVLCEACYAALERAPRASLEAARCFAAIRSSSLGRSSPKNELPGLKRCPTLISTGPSGAAIWIGFVQVQAPVCSR